MPPAANTSYEGSDSRPDRDLSDRVWRLGRAAWGLLGLAGVVVLLVLASTQLVLVVVPLVVALFPATLLVPVAGWLKDRGVPAALASLLTILAGIGLVVSVIGVLIPAVASEAPDLADSASEGIAEIEEVVADLGIGIESVDDLLDRAQDQVGDLGEYTAEALDAAVAAGETVTGAILVMVILFFYLKDGRRLTDGVIATLPERHRSRAGTIAEQAWWTLGAYFRGQLLVALVDAVFIGLGLWILGVPLALPLAVLVFFGGLFPIVGAVVTGMVAVLVALADGGLGPALVVLALVLLVQQLEGNVLEPYVLGRSIRLHPLVILMSITAGSVTLGILGAFLAVPVVAVAARTIEILRDGGADGDGDGHGARASGGGDETDRAVDRSGAGHRAAPSWERTRRLIGPAPVRCPPWSNPRTPPPVAQPGPSAGPSAAAMATRTPSRHWPSACSTRHGTATPPCSPPTSTPAPPWTWPPPPGTRWSCWPPTTVTSRRCEPCSSAVPTRAVPTTRARHRWPGPSSRDTRR